MSILIIITRTKEHSILIMDQTIQIDCVGDSITSGVMPPSYPRILRNVFHQQGMDFVQVSNRGKEGFTVGDYLEFQRREPNDALLERRDVDIFVILLGSNDTRESKKTPLRQFEQSYRELIGLYQQKTKHIFLMNIPLYYAPVHIFWRREYHTFDAANRILHEFNPLLEEMTQDMGIQLIDIYQPLHEAGKKVFIDGIHPNPAGNQIIAETCYHALYPIVKEITTFRNQETQ